MPTLPYAMLVKNGNSEADHTSQFSTFFKGATEFHCYVAFASDSGIDNLWDDLELALNDEMTARFVVGLDFYQTHPNALYSLQGLVEDYKGQVSLHISAEGRKSIFHPKVYVFMYADDTCRLVIGSANLTHGGLSGNHEVSLFYEFKIGAKGGKLLNELEEMFDTLREAGEIVPATDELLAEYDERFRYYALHRKAAEIRAKAACEQTRTRTSALITQPYLDDLRAVLEIMKDDDTTQGYVAQKKSRPQRRQQAKQILENIRTRTGLTKADFLSLYEGLVCAPIHGWHSGNLHRRRVKLAESFQEFQNALQHLDENLRPNTTAEDAYDMLTNFLQGAEQVGPNVMTEILHTYDNTRFAVVNKNSVAGMAMARFKNFPTSPSKKTFTSKRYQEFCTKAELVRKGLDLKDFTELDALFNYAYW